MDKKERQTVWLYPSTKKLIESHLGSANCSSQSEFVENAIRFYCGYLDNNTKESVDYIAPVIKSIIDAIILGSEQRISRILFKLAVEVGANTHLIAATNDIDDETMAKLRSMCTDEVRRINGIINFEKAVLYQRSDD